MLEVVNKLPAGVELSEHLTEGTTHYLVLMHFGRKFFIPITNDISKALNISKGGKPLAKPYAVRNNFARELLIESSVRIIINSIYLQVRDNILSEIEDGITRDVLENIGNLMAKPLRKEIEARATEAEQKALPEHIEPPKKLRGPNGCPREFN